MSDEQERTAPDRISRDEYQTHDRSIIQLQEFRKHHEEEHKNHVATQAWVYSIGWKALAATLTLAVAIAILIERLIASS